MSDNPPVTDEETRAGLALLRRASVYAKDAEADLWDFAIEIDSMYDSGMTVSDLRWLVSMGYVQHGQESSVYGDAHRSFQTSNGLNFAPTTCFVLTPSGLAFAEKILKEPAAT